MTNDEFEVDEEFLFIGRTFEEYLSLFGLDRTDLAPGPILDCPGGPSSFTAVASALGTAVHAVDPMYEHGLSELEATCHDAIERNVSQLQEKRELFVWDYYEDVETRGRYLRAAAERFLTDYARHPERYVASGLPELPFDDDAFELTLSGNLLFVYDDRLDRDFHEAAARELLRVTSGDVRLFPLSSLDRTRSAFVEDSVATLRAEGVEVNFETVDYEFQPGATEVLVLSD
jgi:hypothetical protein